MDRMYLPWTEHSYKKAMNEDMISEKKIRED